MSVLLLSGGVDSLVLLAREVAAGRNPLCVSFAYGQRHFRELYAGNAIAWHYGVEQTCLTLPANLLEGSALTGAGDVPVGKHFTDPSQAATVVPNRNLLFIAAAATEAVRRGLGMVLFACHAGDSAIYLDCRPEFVHAADTALYLACGVHVAAPFLSMSKREIVQLGRELNAPLEMAWSCYMGGDEPCGQCGACVERVEAEAA